MAGVGIRLARPGDGGGLARLHLDTAAGLRALDPERFRLPDMEGFARWLDHDLGSMGETWVCFVAEEEDRIVGQVEAILHQPLGSARYQTMSHLGEVRGEVNSLGVLASHRRRGIATALMSRVEDWLRERGARSIRLDTFLGSDESGPFYDAIGYSRTAVIFERRMTTDPPS